MANPPFSPQLVQGLPGFGIAQADDRRHAGAPPRGVRAAAGLLHQDTAGLDDGEQVFQLEDAGLVQRRILPQAETGK